MSGEVQTHKAIEADPVWVHLAARCALYLEGIEVRFLLGILGTEVGDAVREQRRSLAYLLLHM